MVHIFSEKYTTEEIEFNKMEAEVLNAIGKLNGEIDKITSTLSKYGFEREDVANWILEKLKCSTAHVRKPRVDFLFGQTACCSVK